MTRDRIVRSMMFHENALHGLDLDEGLQGGVQDVAPQHVFHPVLPAIDRKLIDAGKPVRVVSAVHRVPAVRVVSAVRVGIESPPSIAQQSTLLKILGPRAFASVMGKWSLGR